MGDDIVPNTGLISHAFRLGSGDDKLTNAGLFTCDVTLYGGDDTYSGIADGIVTGTIYRYGGKDTITGGDRSDETLLLRGGRGADVLKGSNIANALFGGDDRIFLLDVGIGELDAADFAI